MTTAKKPSTTKKTATTPTSKKPATKANKTVAKKTLKNKPAEKAGKDANTTSVKKSSTKLTITQKYEYLDRVSAFALYTNSTIVKRTDDTTTFRMPITITRSSKKEVTNIELELCAAPDIDFSNVPFEEKGKVLFKNVCDAIRLGRKYNTITFTTAYGDKYSYNGKGVTQMYNAKTKKWEVVPTCKTECQK